jgi:basic membrane protein A
MKKRRITLALAVLFICALALMAVEGRIFTRTGSENGGNEDAWRPGVPIDKARLRIGVIHITNPTYEQSGFAYAHELGIQEMRRAIGLDDAAIIHKNSISDTNPVEMEHAMRECIAAGARVIIATSWGYMDTCEKLAREFPGVVFAHASGYKRHDSNFTNYFGRIYEPRYLSGIAAGLRTETNKIGYVAAMGKNNSEVTGGIDAFAIGVESVNPDARIYVRVTERWYDPPEEANAARDLISDGCDVIAQHTDSDKPQTEARRAGVWGVGYNDDVGEHVPDTVIVSVVWNWGVYYTRLIRSVIDGSFTTAPYFGGMRDGMVGLSPLNETILPSGAREVIEVARGRVESGEFGIFDGVMETNDGRLVGKEGETLSDSEITFGIDWYYRNVIER